MSRWMCLSVLCLVLCASGCGNEEDTSKAARVFDQLSARETAYHASVNRLPDAAAIRSATTEYAQDMGDLLDSMQEACRDMMHGGSMMGDHSMDDMTAIMDSMRHDIASHNFRMQDMDDMDDMRATCSEHHAIMADALRDMQGELEDVMPCCGGH